MRRAIGGLTVCVTGCGVCVGNVREQRKIEARYLPENGDETTLPFSRIVSSLIFFQHISIMKQIYLE
jgi:hypothetical protein